MERVEHVVIPRNEQVKRVFIGIGKAIDPTPRAWNERIIHGMNHIIPKLSLEWQMWVARHTNAIETGAKAAGIVVSTAELYTIFLLARLAKTRIDRGRILHEYQATMKNFLRRDQWMHDIQSKLHNVGGDVSQQKEALVGALAFLVAMISDEVYLRQHQTGQNRQQIKPGIISILAKPSSKQQAEESLRDALRMAYGQQQRYEAGLHGRNPPDDQMLSEQASHMYGLWKEIGFQGVPGLLHQAGIGQKTRRAYQKFLNIDRETEGPTYLILGDPRLVRDPVTGTVSTVQEVKVRDTREDALHAIQERRDSLGTDPKGRSMMRAGKMYEKNARRREGR